MRNIVTYIRRPYKDDYEIGVDISNIRLFTCSYIPRSHYQNRINYAFNFRSIFITNYSVNYIVILHDQLGLQISIESGMGDDVYVSVNVIIYDENQSRSISIYMDKWLYPSIRNANRTVIRENNLIRMKQIYNYVATGNFQKIRKFILKHDTI